MLGVPHPDFGEVPVAVVKDLENVEGADQIKQAVTSSLGAAYAL